MRTHQQFTSPRPVGWRLAAMVGLALATGLGLSACAAGGVDSGSAGGYGVAVINTNMPKANPNSPDCTTRSPRIKQPKGPDANVNSADLHRAGWSMSGGALNGGDVIANLVTLRVYGWYPAIKAGKCHIPADTDNRGWGHVYDEFGRNGFDPIIGSKVNAWISPDAPGVMVYTDSEDGGVRLVRWSHSDSPSSWLSSLRGPWSVHDLSTPKTSSSKRDTFKVLRLGNGRSAAVYVS